MFFHYGCKPFKKWFHQINYNGGIYLKNRRSSIVALAATSTMALAMTFSVTVPNVFAKGKATAPVEQISFWYGLGGQLSSDVQQMVSLFNKTHPGIHVTATYQGSYSGGGPEQQKLIAALGAGTAPTMAQIEVHSMPVFASSGHLMNLTSFMHSSKTDNTVNFLKGMLVSTQYQGQYYGIPFNRSVPVLYYNKTYFKRAGISSPPITWNQLALDAKKLTKGSGKSKVYGFEPLVDWWPWEATVWSNGGQILSPNLKQALFDTPQATHILSIWQNLIKQGYATVETSPQYWTLTTEDFIHGRTAMDVDSIGDAGEVTSGIGNKFNWGTAMLPKGTSLNVPPGGGDIAIMTGASADKVKAAETFIEWWTSPIRAAQWSEMTGYLPVQTAAVKEKSYQDYLKKHPQYRTALNELKYQHAAPASANYLAVLQYAEQALQGVLDEGKPVQATMHAAAVQADSVL